MASAVKHIAVNQLLTPENPGFYRELLDQMSDGVYFVDRERRIQYWNEGAYRLTGYRAEELVGKCWQDDALCHVDTDGRRLLRDECPITATIAGGDPHEARVFLLHKEGRRVPVSVRVQPVRGADGAIVGAIEIFRDDSARNHARRKIDAMKRLAFLDHLTQLPNRRFVETAVETALREFEIHKSPFGVFVADFDGFKKINDTYGHGCGDRALQQMAFALTGSLRPTDTIGRWGGDEFLSIVRNVDAAIMKKLAERCVVLVKRLSVPAGDQRNIHLSISVGAALSRSGESAQELIHRADELMYRSKAAGRGRATCE